METKFYIAAHALIKNNWNEILVLKRSPDNDYMPNKWDIPGGTIEPYEDHIDALKREIREETGLELWHASMQSIYVHTNTTSLPEKQYFQLIFECTVASDEVRIVLDDEHSGYAWLSIRALDSYDTIEFLKCYINEELH